MKKGHRSMGVAIVYVLVGGLVGSILGHLLQPVWAPLGQTLIAVGSRPGSTWSINLGFVGLQLGGWIQLNVMGVVGLIVGLLWYRRSV